MNFSEKSCRKCFVSLKNTKIHRFGKNLQLFEKTTMFWRFDEHCSKKLQKAARAVKKHEKSSIWPNLCNFSNKLRCFCISMNFQGKSCQKCFVSHEKSSIWPKLCNFSSRLPCFGNEVFSKKSNSASFREKARKIVDLAKTRNFSNKLPCFDALVNFSAKSCRKCFVFWENSTNHRLGQNLQLFRTKYHVYAFRWTFQQKVQKVASFREKARKIIDLPKTCNFSNKLPCFGISMIIAGKSCKKVEKVAHFVKNDEKSSIWPKLATFRGNYHVSAFLSTFQQKVSHFVKKHEKSSFGSCLAHS